MKRIVLACCLGLSLGSTPVHGGWVLETVRWEVGAPDAAGSVPLTWEGAVTPAGTERAEFRVGMVLRDGRGAEAYACASATQRGDAAQPAPLTLSCLVPADAWARAQEAVAEVFPPAAATTPAEPLARPAASRPAGDPGPSERERELDAAREKLDEAEQELAEVQEEYNGKSEDFLKICAGGSTSGGAESSRCERLRGQLEKLQKDVQRARDRRDRARRAYDRAKEAGE